MSENKPSKKKVIATKRTSAAGERVRRSSVQKQPQELIYKKENYIWMGAGAGLILLGMLLMMGGSMPSPDVWDDSLIYSFRRTVLAPFVILSGLAVEIYAIFKRA